MRPSKVLFCHCLHCPQGRSRLQQIHKPQPYTNSQRQYVCLAWHYSTQPISQCRHFNPHADEVQDCLVSPSQPVGRATPRDDGLTSGRLTEASQRFAPAGFSVSSGQGHRQPLPRWVRQKIRDDHLTHRPRHRGGAPGLRGLLLLSDTIVSVHRSDTITLLVWEAVQLNLIRSPSKKEVKQRHSNLSQSFTRIIHTSTETSREEPGGLLCPGEVTEGISRSSSHWKCLLYPSHWEPRKREEWKGGVNGFFFKREQTPE